MRKMPFCILVFLSFPLFARESSFTDLLAPKVTPPGDNETCFSPDEPCAAKLDRFMQSAEKTLDIAIYSINLENVVDTLIKKNDKTKIRIVVDKVQAHGAKSRVRQLLEGGVNVRYGKQKGIMHNKFVIVDHRMLETGSFNYTNHASIANQENQIYLANPQIVMRYVERFEWIWENSVEINLPELIREIEREHTTHDKY